MKPTDSSHIAIATLFESARMNRELDGASQSHVAGCDFCTGRLSWMQTAAGMGQQEALFEPPQQLMDKVLRLGRSPARLKQLRNFIVAALTFDSFSSLAPAGIRRSELASRQMTYEADDVEIGLWVRRSEDQTVMLTGQVLRKSGEPIEDPAAHVDLVVDGEHIATSALSQWGEFVFADTPRTPYGLHVSFLERVLRVPLLPIIDDDKPQP